MAPSFAVFARVLRTLTQQGGTARRRRSPALLSLGVAALAACAGPERPTTGTLAPRAPDTSATNTTTTLSRDGNHAAENAAPCADPARCALPPAPDAPPTEAERAGATNLDGAPLAVCSEAPLTGYYRDGRCATGPDDRGVHVVCAQVTRAFLDFSRGRGNDLVTPIPGRFPGLRPGDRWCLCAARWEEARLGGAAPPIVREATERRALDFTSRAALDAHALGGSAPPR